MTDLERGRAFHEALDGWIRSSDQHANDDAHNAAVGQAIRQWLGGDTAGAITEYNRFAHETPYERVSAVVAQPDGSIAVWFPQAVAHLGADGQLLSAAKRGVE